MKQYLMLGDTHGDLDFVRVAAALAAQHDAEIIQVGDWAFLWPSSNQLQALSLILARAGEEFAKPPVTMRFCDGNHDHHPKLREMINGRVPVATWLADHVIYQPRGSVHEDEDGTRFLFCGGAPSIDKWNRTEGRSWWPEETITEEEYDGALAAEGPIHVLVTHDAPDYPPGFAPLGEPEFRVQSRRSMEMVAGLIVKHRPSVHYHGHWHKRYSMVNNNGTVTYGLGSNFHFADATMLWSRP